ncbi:hypothetical protein PoB_000317000 [Plakobranchus ocellatus]|uniref:Uncharacterized protein n=1 Tax=Plakobranchus ocellatus TaxID=259542 RepID=A0AAV3Y187_9GAST|nr:hypothetical protein PoB_000317000 [Plakobranchus ocellatus]
MRERLTGRKSLYKVRFLYIASPQQGDFNKVYFRPGRRKRRSNPRQKGLCRYRGGLASHCAIDATPLCTTKLRERCNENEKLKSGESENLEWKEIDRMLGRRKKRKRPREIQKGRSINKDGAGQGRAEYKDSDKQMEQTGKHIDKKYEQKRQS